MHAVLILLLFVYGIVQAEVITDGTVGPVQNLSGPGFTIEQSLGSTVGNNLFHSFERFNIQQNENATFTGSNNLRNVISRVTGGQSSTINGNLRSTISNAAFYFVNPSGIVIGNNAQIDVPGDFHLSSADSLKFEDGLQFSASQVSNSTLSASDPVSFGFLNNHSESIQIQQSELRFKEGSSVTLSGSSLVIDNGSLLNRTGNIKLYATGSDAVEVFLDDGTQQSLNGDILINNGSNINVSGEGAGQVIVRAGNLNLSDAGLRANNFGAQGIDANNDNGIDISVESLSMDQSSALAANTFSEGNAANINISTGMGMELKNGSQISNDSFNKGNSGSININNGTSLSLLSGGQIRNSAQGDGDAGTLRIESAGSLLIDGEGHSTSTGVFSEVESGSTGLTGDISVNADAITINRNNSSGEVGIFNRARGNREPLVDDNVGNIRIESNTLNIFNGGRVDSSTFGKSDAGNIDINVAEKLEIDRGGSKSSTGIFAVTGQGSEGDAGIITINATGQAADISLLSGGQIRSSTNGAGNAGGVVVKNFETMLFDADESIFSTAIVSEAAPASTGLTGNIEIDVGEIIIKNNNHQDSSTGIFSRARGTGTGRNNDNVGNISVKSANLTMLNGGGIDSRTLGELDAGNIDINVSDTIVVDRQGSIFSTGVFTSAESGSDGSAGTININGGADLSLLNGGEVKSSTASNGNAGEIIVDRAGILLIDGANSMGGSDGDASTGIFSEVEPGSNGLTGNITVNADEITINRNRNNQAVGIFNRAFGNRVSLVDDNVGNIGVKSNEINLLNGGRIDSSTFGNSDAGDISMDVFEKLEIDREDSRFATGIFAVTGSNSSGEAGIIAINAMNQGAEISLLSGGQIRSSTNGEGNAGGVIVRDFETLFFDAEDSIFSTIIVSEANPNSTGLTGNIDIDVGDIIIKNNNNRDSSTGLFSRARGMREASEADMGGNIKVKSTNLTLLNGGRIDSRTLGNTNAGNINISVEEDILIDRQGNDNSINTTGIFTIAELNSKGNAGSITIERGANLSVVNGGEIQSSTDGGGNAGNIVLEQVQTILIDGQQGSESGLSTGIFSESGTNSAGDAGTITINETDSLGLINRGEVSTTTKSLTGQAGVIDITANKISITNNSAISSASEGLMSSGKTGSINLTANNQIHLVDEAEISIENEAELTDSNAAAGIIPGTITINSPEIDLKNSAITTESTGNIAAGSININFSDRLGLDPSFISTSANTGNGGKITIEGGKLIDLQDSGFLTSVAGADSNGGDITVSSEIFVMDTAVLQANAVGGSGGDIVLDFRALIPSNNEVIVGGPRVNWAPFSGSNVIQAASETGVSGNISLTSPQLDISGSIIGLDSGGLVLPVIENNPCRNLEGTSSTLSRTSKGGLPFNESQTGYIPPAARQIDTHIDPESLNRFQIFADTTLQKEKHPCFAM